MSDLVIIRRHAKRRARTQLVGFAWDADPGWVDPFERATEMLLAHLGLGEVKVLGSVTHLSVGEWDYEIVEKGSVALDDDLEGRPLSM